MEILTAEQILWKNLLKIEGVTQKELKETKAMDPEIHQALLNGFQEYADQMVLLAANQRNEKT